MCVKIILRGSNAEKNFNISIYFTLIFFSCTRLPKTQEKTSEINKILRLYDNWELEEAAAITEGLSDIPEADRLNILIQKRVEKKSELEHLLLDLKKALYTRDYDKIEEYMSKSIANIIKFRKIKNIDFAESDIYFSGIKYYKNSANIVMLINFYEDTNYIDLEFRLINNHWKLVSFVERR